MFDLDNDQLQSPEVSGDEECRIAQGEESIAAAQEEVVAEESQDAAEVAESAAIPGFDSFGLHEELLRGVEEAGFKEPTPIQLKAIPVALTGRDLLGQALTGTGKTAAFGLPGMHRILGKEGLQMLVLTPTRELAAQISSELFKLGHFTGLKTAAFTGGQSYRRQEELLDRGVNILVATPGRLIDLIESGHFHGVEPSVIVVDEADEMLDMGFIDDVKDIFGHFTGEHQTMLFSATMPKQIVNLAGDILNDPLKIETDYPESANNEIEQSYFVIEDFERTNAIVRLIESEQVSKAIIFCRTREETDALNILLGGRGYNVNCLHGDMEQAQRSRVMAAYRRGDFDILVATDVAARGIDVDDVSHVFNYHIPFDSRAYVHRIGRTGRAGKTGKAITFVTPRELRSLEAIRRSVGAKLSLGTIPSRQEVNAQRLQRLLGELFASNLDPELYNTVCEMSRTQDQDPAVLFTKMISRHLAATADQGPEFIGLPPEKVERLMQQRRGPRGGRRGGYRGGRDFNRGERDFNRGERDFNRGERDFNRGERDFNRGERDFNRGERDFNRGERDFNRGERSERGYSRGDRGDRPSRGGRDFGGRDHSAHAYGGPRRFGKEGGGFGGGHSAPQPPPPRLNPDGTPILNRRQRRLLKFGPPRQDGGAGRGE